MTAIPSITTKGVAIPAIGFGTSQVGGDCGPVVATALKAGYRHIDAARKYGTEEGVGDGLRAAKVPRGELFIVTKVSHENLHATDFARSVDESLKALGVDYIDLLLVHWPNAAIPLAGTMGALAEEKKKGRARHVGVANFNLAMIDEAQRLCSETLVTLQGECHPYLDSTKLLAGLKARGLALTAYCPLGRGRLMNDQLIAEIARAHNKSVAQIALRWLIQQGGIIPIPRSTNPQRIAENLRVFDFELSADDMARIATLKRPDGRIANPAGRAPAWD